MNRILIIFVFLFFTRSNVFAQWQLRNGPYSGYTTCLAQNKKTNTIIAATDLGLYRQKSNSNSWEFIDEKDSFFYTQMFYIGIDDSLIMVTREGKLRMSADDGDTWTTVYVDSNLNYVGLIYCDENIIIVQTSNGVYSSNDDGISFVKSLWNISNPIIKAFTMDGNRMILLNHSGLSYDLYYSDDSGLNWIFSKTITNFAGYSATLFRVFDGNIYLVDDYNIYISQDHGSTWTTMNIGPQYHSFNDIYVSNGTIMLGMYDFHGVIISHDNGLTYTPYYNGLPLQKIEYSYFLSTNIRGLIVASSMGIFNSFDLGLSWNDLNNNLTAVQFSGIAQCNNRFFIGSINHQGVFASYDGSSWNRMSNGLDFFNRQFTAIHAMIAVGNRVIVTTEGGIYYSDNYGSSWIAGGSLPGSNNCLEYANGKLYACTPNGLYYSLDTAKSWVPLPASGNYVFDVKVNGNLIISSNVITGSTTSFYMFRSENYGNTFTVVNTPYTFSQVEMIDNVLLANAGFLIKSSDQGLSWSQDSMLGNANISDIYIYNNKTVLISTLDGRIYYSNDKTNTWNDITANFKDNAKEISFFGNYLYVASPHYGIWRRYMPELADLPPSPFVIYPNPVSDFLTIFNPELNSPLSISIYTILGQLLLKKTIIEHESSIDFRNYARGVYLLQYENNIDSGALKVVKY